MKSGKVLAKILIVAFIVTQCARCEDGVSEQPDGAADTLTTEPPVGGDTNTGADGGADQGTMSPDSDDDSAITTAGSVVSEAEDAGSDPQELTTSSPAAAATAQPLTTASAQPAADIQASTESIKASEGISTESAQTTATSNKTQHTTKTTDAGSSVEATSQTDNLEGTAAPSAGQTSQSATTEPAPAVSQETDQSTSAVQSGLTTEPAAVGTTEAAESVTGTKATDAAATTDTISAHDGVTTEGLSATTEETGASTRKEETSTESDEPTTQTTQSDHTTQPDHTTHSDHTSEEATTDAAVVSSDATTTSLPDTGTTSQTDTSQSPASTEDGEAWTLTSQDSVSSTSSSEELASTVTQQDVTSQTSEDVTTSTAAPAPLDPCHASAHTVLSHHWRHFASIIPADSNRYYSDANLTEGWYKFEYRGAAAQMPTVCLKTGQCSSKYPMRVDLGKESMPSEGQTRSATVQTLVTVDDMISCTVFQKDIQIKGCPGSFYVYRLPPAVSGSVYCIQPPDETIPLELHGDYIPPATTQTTTTTTVATTTARIPVPTTIITKKSCSHQKLDDSKKVEVDNTITVVFERRADSIEVEDFCHEKFPKLLIEYLNKHFKQPAAYNTPVPNVDHDAEGVATTKMPQTTKPDEKRNLVPNAEEIRVSNLPGKVHDVDPNANGPVPKPRTKRDTKSQDIGHEDLIYIGSAPQIKKDGKLEVSLFVKNRTAQEGLVPGSVLLRAIEELNATGSLQNELNMTVVSVFPGLPNNQYEPKPVLRTAAGLWEEHMGLFICMIVLATLCLVIIVLGLICIHCRRSQGYSRDDKSPIHLEDGTPEKQPLPADNPLSDEEITRGEAQMCEKNGGGQHLSKKDEDNGWVVPISELSAGERQQPEVEDTKL